MTYRRFSGGTCGAGLSDSQAASRDVQCLGTDPAVRSIPTRPLPVKSAWQGIEPFSQK